jgi:hypothetical protein
MAPLINQALMRDSNDDVFSNENFLWPMKLELEAASWENCVPAERSTTVRFELETEVINPFPEDYTDEDVQVKWYCMDDLQQIKQRAKEESNELRKSSKGQDTCLCVAHRKTSLMIKSDFKSLVKLSPSTPDQDLSEWCSYMDGRRGLERFASRDYAALRRNDICNTRAAVMQEYARQSEFYLSDPEAIANVAREASKRARTFARFFAAADADAAKPDQPARRIPSRCHSEVRTISRCAPPRKRSKQYHRQDFFTVPSC